MARKAKKVMSQKHVTAQQNGRHGSGASSPRNANFSATGGAKGVGKGGSGQGAMKQS